MAFLHTWALALGVAAVSLPLLIHWLTRPRPLRVPLSTIRFVQQAVHQRRAHHRLRDFLILLLRAMAVLLLGFAFARPLLGQRPLISAGDTATAVRVVLLDVSQSMAARERGIERFERARSAAAGYLTYRSGLVANLVLAAADARAVFAQPSSNFSALRDELARAGVLPQRLNVQTAITLAAEMFGAAGTHETRRELVIISDFQQTNWAAVDFGPLPQDTLIQLESVGSPEPPPNVGLLRVAAAGRAERGKEVRVEVEVGNYAGAARPVEVELACGPATVRLAGQCPANGTTTLTGEVAPGETGWQSGEARLLNIEDALAADNVRPFVLEVRPATTYALITRQRAEPKPSSSYFLERGLVPFVPEPSAERAGPSVPSGQRVLRVDPAQLERETLAPADLIVLAHPGKLGQEAVNLLAGLLLRGRPVLYVAAEPIDAVNLRLLADAAGPALRMPVEFVPPAAGQPRQNLTLGSLRRDVCPFTVFGDKLTVLVEGLRFTGGLNSRPLAGGLADDVLAAYRDGSASLVVTAAGTGWLAVLNADLANSNLPGSPMFVPLLGELSERLLAQRRTMGALACGEPLVAYLPAEAGAAAGLQIEVPHDTGAGGALGLGPRGSTPAGCGELIEDSTGVLWRWNVVGPPGVYVVKRDVPVFALAAATPAEESDLRSLPPDALQGRLAGNRNVYVQAAGGDEQLRDDRWVWLGVACVGCLLLELLLLKLFRT